MRSMQIANRGGGLKNKAFTLIELLAVIVILAIIALIATPVILNIIEKAKKSAFQNSAYGIIESGKIYYSEQMLTGGLSKEKNFILEPGKSSELNFKGTVPNGVVSVTADGKVGIAIYDDKWCASKSKDSDEVVVTKYEEGKCIIPDIANDPVLTLKGNKVVLVKENMTYEDAGVEAKTVAGDSLQDKVETTITKDGSTVIEIDTSILDAIYTITYKVESNNKIATETRTVKIIDGTSPIITFNPETVELETEEVDSYNIFTGVTVIDNVDGDIEANSTNVSIEGNLLKMPGTYEITYSVVDETGNRTSKTRTFIVKDLTKPEITIEPNEQSTYVQSKIITISATDNMKLGSISYVLIKDDVRGDSNTIISGDTITLNETGNYKIEVIAQDESGNSETKTSGTYLLDNTKPTIEIPESTIVKITEITTYDLKTGVTYSDNTGIMPTLAYEGSLTSTLGSQTITYTVTDEAGNYETETRTITVVEADGPILNYSSIDSDDIYIAPTTITVTAVDNSNLKTFTYEVFKDGTSLGVTNVSVSGKSAEKGVSLSETGSYTIKLTASDEYGTSNTATSGTYLIDNTKPTQSFAIDTQTTGSNNWYKALSIKVTGSDTHSGPETIKYCITTNDTCTPNETYSSVITLDSNALAQKVCANSIDKAGNASNITCSDSYKVDTTAPTQSFAVTSSPTGSNSWYKALSLSVTGTDEHSGVSTIQYCTTTSSTCEPNQPYSSAVALDSNASAQRICANVTNAAGITSATTCSDAYKVDTSSPTITATTSSLTVAQGTSYAVTNFYTASYGISGGSTVCKVGSTTVTNLSGLGTGSHTLTCTATGGNGNTASTSISVKIVSSSYKCVRAELATLHTETCTQTSNYCAGSGLSGTTIKYGNETVTAGQLTPGDAFDCDVNGDGQYNPTTERFYYVSGLESDNRYAVLIYYNNTTGGVADNTSANLIAYYSAASENWHGPETAKTNLPTTAQWKNVSLSNTTRAIVTDTGGTATEGGTLPTSFSYSGYAARLLTYKEVVSACGTAKAPTDNGYLDTCKYFMENTKYVNNGLETSGFWLETPRSDDARYAWTAHSGSRRVYSYLGRSGFSYAARPAIEVLKTNISM